MPKRSKDRPFHLSFQVLFRLVIFIAIIYLSINYFSNSSLNINLPLPNVVQYLPPQSQKVLGDTTTYLQSSQLNNKLNEGFNFIKEFPQKHLQQFKVDLVNTIAREIVDRIQKK